jgi:hypothetical protein
MSGRGEGPLRGKGWGSAIGTSPVLEGQAIHVQLRRQCPLSTDLEEHANGDDHWVFECPWISGRRQVCRPAGL